MAKISKCNAVSCFVVQDGFITHMLQCNDNAKKLYVNQHTFSKAHTRAAAYAYVVVLHGYELHASLF